MILKEIENANLYHIKFCQCRKKAFSSDKMVECAEVSICTQNWIRKLDFVKAMTDFVLVPCTANIYSF